MSATVTRDDAGGAGTLAPQRPGLLHAPRTDLLAARRAGRAVSCARHTCPIPPAAISWWSS